METLEPWLRGTLTEVEPIRRAVLQALELAHEDAERWADDLTAAELFARPHGLPSVAFQLTHMARSLDRLLTYAEGGQLNEVQLAALKTEMATGSPAAVWAEFRAKLKNAMLRVWAINPSSFGEVRAVGRKMLPTTVAGLLIHCAEHTQRHVGQLITTAKVLRSMEP